MARGINKVILVGNLGQDPDTKAMPSGMTVCNIRIATSESWKDKTSGEMKEQTEWHSVAMFGRLAEIAGEYLRKGSQVYVEGSLRTDKYTDKEGIERFSTDIIANEMQMLGGKPGAGEGGGSRSERPERSNAPRSGGGGGNYGGSDRGGGGGSSRPAAPQPSNTPFDDDEIPF